jgi:hypothetical protein
LIQWIDDDSGITVTGVRGFNDGNPYEFLYAFNFDNQNANELLDYELHHNRL